MKLWKTTPFIISPKKPTNYLGVNITKDARDLYTEKYKSLFKEIKDLNKWKNVWYSWTASFNIFRMAIMIYGFTIIPIKIPTVFFFFSEMNVCYEIYTEI